MTTISLALLVLTAVAWWVCLSPVRIAIAGLAAVVTHPALTLGVTAAVAGVSIATALAVIHRQSRRVRIATAPHPRKRDRRKCMRPYDIAAALTAVTDQIGAFWEGDGDRRDCLAEVEDRLTGLIARIYQEGDPT